MTLDFPLGIQDQGEWLNNVKEWQNSHVQDIDKEDHYNMKNSTMLKDLWNEGKTSSRHDKDEKFKVKDSEHKEVSKTWRWNVIKGYIVIVLEELIKVRNLIKMMQFGNMNNQN